MMYQEWGKLDIPSYLGPHYQCIQIFYSSPKCYMQQKHGWWQKWQQDQQKLQQQQQTTKTTATKVILAN